MNAIENVLRWLLQSSANPNEVSLTVKGLLIGAVPVAMVFLGLAHVNLGQDQLTAVVDAIVNVFQDGLMLISAGATLYGIVRKVWLSLSASHAA
jgi:hypothetical protein